ETDSLQYNAKHSSTENFFKFLKLKKIPEWTKRLILKLSATVYDPLGLISPFTVKSRSILQTLWKEDLKWDDKVPLTYMTKWNEWLGELFKLSALVKIPRFLQFTSDRKIQLHVFCDASTKAFATCVYARVLEGPKKTSRKKKSENAREEDSGNVISVLLITAKARVTPSKTESVSRLELAGCVIGTRLGNAVANAYDMNTDEVYYWTDSSNCLYWLNTPSSSLKTFVSNRVGEIHNSSKIEMWRHVPTDQNPADIPTRMPKIEELAGSRLWWNGPEFLMKSEDNWPPKFIPAGDSEEAKIEFKKTLLNFTICSETSEEETRQKNGKKKVTVQERLNP
ncbi:MAG: hypothetical protein ACOYB0_11175, partial [Polynucleobacter sp.]